MKITRLLILGLMLLGLLWPYGASAQMNSQFFPETGRTVAGRFLEYWKSNGGLAVFGFPVSDQFQENGQPVQYFERQRFEAHPENARPYDVLLGRLGAQLLGPSVLPVANGPASGCIWFPEVQHNVCNQQTSVGFASYWQLNGLEFDGLSNNKSYQESLALFGYPLTEAIEYTTPDGTRVQAQWFERTRFEWHPNNPNPYKVLLGRLGADVAPNTPVTPPPATVNRVKIFLIAVGGNGVDGKLVGCGDSVVPVEVAIEPTPAPLQGALTRLLASKDQGFGESGLYNALYQSDLRLDRVTVIDGRATVQISGTVRFSGVCDTPRVKAQIEETVRQFPSVTSADIFINNVPLADVQ